MKKVLILSIIIVLFIIVGCDYKVINNDLHNNIEQKSESHGRMYQLITLSDTNIRVFQGLIPEGWKSAIKSERIVNSSHPLKETVTFTSPDSLAKLKIISQTSFVDNKKYEEGVNYDYFTTYLHYMEAKDYIDYYMNEYYPNSKYVGDEEIKNETLEQLKLYSNMLLEQGQKDAQKLNESTRQITTSVSDAGISSSIKKYDNGQNKILVSISTLALKTCLTSSILSQLSSESITWIIPYMIIFEAENEDAYNKYYDDYKFIVTNSSFTVDYYALVEYMSSAITNTYTSYYAAKSQAGLDAMNEYIDSNYSSTSSKSTNEKVMEMWDDVIKEQDKYTLEDGSTIKTSIYNETVAQNGNEIYIGDKSGIPNGFTELSKGY